MFNWQYHIDHSVYGRSQWEETLQCNVASHWLSPQNDLCNMSNSTEIIVWGGTGAKPLPIEHIMTSSNGNIFRVTGRLCGEFTGPGEFPAQRPMTRSFDTFFDLRLNKRLSKQSWGWWFETPSRSLWRHRNECCPIHWRTYICFDSHQWFNVRLHVSITVLWLVDSLSLYIHM